MILRTLLALQKNVFVKSSSSSSCRTSFNHLLIEALLRDLASKDAGNFASEFLIEYLIAGSFKAMVEGGSPQRVVDCIPTTSSRGDVEMETTMTR